MSQDKETDKVSNMGEMDVLTLAEKWKRSKLGKVVESSLFGGIGCYYIYCFKTIKNNKGYQQMTTMHKLRLKMILAGVSLGLFYLTACRILDTAMFHPYKSLGEQIKEETEWMKDKKDQFIGKKPVKESKDS